MLLSSFVAAVYFGFSHDAKTQTKPQMEEAELWAASAKAIRRIQQLQSVRYKKQTCPSCHHQLPPEITLTMARERGVSDKPAGAHHSLPKPDAMNLNWAPSLRATDKRYYSGLQLNVGNRRLFRGRLCPPWRLTPEGIALL